MAGVRRRSGKKKKKAGLRWCWKKKWRNAIARPGKKKARTRISKSVAAQRRQLGVVMGPTMGWLQSKVTVSACTSTSRRCAGPRATADR